MAPGVRLVASKDSSLVALALPMGWSPEPIGMSLDPTRPFAHRAPASQARHLSRHI